MLPTVALLVALSGGPDYATIAQQLVPAPVAALPVGAPPAPAAPVSAESSAVVADVVPTPTDPRLAPAFDWVTWDLVAACETGGRWDAQGARYGGGLQILTSTWQAFGGTEFAPRPGLATREQQIVVGRAIQAAGGWRQWPGCAQQLDLA
jgi:resuscitation-promoting factor RpfA